MANRIDPDETVHIEPSHQDLHSTQNVLVCRVEKVNCEWHRCSIMNNIGVKSLLHKGLSEPDFYDNL